MTTITRPYLPKKFVKDLLKIPMMKGCPVSPISDPAFAKWLREFATCGPDQALQDPELLKSLDAVVVPGSHKTIVNYAGRRLLAEKNDLVSLLMAAIQDGDVLLAAELVRLGADVNVKHEALGLPPLGYAVQALMRATGTISHQITSTGAELILGQPEIQRRRAIVKLLLGQHANVDCGLPALQYPNLLCILMSLRDWELLALLLEHGFEHSEFERDFRSKVPRVPRAMNNLFRADRPRPARKCPCFSGLALADCHAAEPKPYPDDLTCPCYSNKRYGACCKLRNMRRWELWDPKQNWIAAVAEHDLRPVLVDGVSIPNRYAEAVLGHPEVEWIISKATAVRLSAMRDEGLVDPAFFFAYEKMKGWVARPLGRAGSKELCKADQKRWNDAVDLYISTGNDPRPRLDIERAAKIGQSLGALYKFCENPGCEKMEGRDVDKLSVCSRCRMAVYCGKSCQTAAWKEHKTVCGGPSQCEQRLPSQVNIDAHMTGRLIVDEFDDQMMESFAQEFDSLMTI